MSDQVPELQQPTAGLQSGEDDNDLVAQLLPVEGLMALAALLVMFGTVALAIDDAQWAGFIAGTRDSQTTFLFFGAILSVLVGLAVAKSSLSMIRAHAIGSFVGALFLLTAVAGVVSNAAALEDRLRALSSSVNLFGWEVFVLGYRSSETSVFLLTIGGLLWASGQFAGFAIFRYQRALPAIAVAAIPLLVNVSLTIREQYMHVVVFTAAGLLLLVRMNLLQQLRSWEARAIGEAPRVGSAFLRAGAVFVTLALVGSITLAANTNSAPLSSAWRNLDEQLLEFGFEVNRMLGGVTGEGRGSNVLFAPAQTIPDQWESSDAIAFTATSNDTTGRAHRWRGATYDTFDGRYWRWGAERTKNVVQPGEDVLAYSAESIAADPRREAITFTVTPAALGGNVFVSPDGPIQLSEAAEVEALSRGDGAAGGFTWGRLVGGLREGVPYSLLAAVWSNDRDKALTANQLAAAGTDYPEWVVASYAGIQPGSIGEIVYERANDIVASLAPEKRNPYHIADAFQNWLRQTGGFTYTTDVKGLCGGGSRIDCFLEMKRGFCVYFASTMAMMLRTQGIPARYAVGYLPGRPLGDGAWEVPLSAAHAWVEVYFPGYGWVTFDPTPGSTGNVNEPTTFAPGPPVSGPVASPFALPYQDFDDLDPRNVLPFGGESPGSGGGADLLLFAALALGAFLGGLLLMLAFLLRRTPKTEPELAYRSVARLAARFGYGPRPTQTAYEYAESLGDLVPAVRPELHVLATAKVEAKYGARSLSSGALDALSRAYARVRIGLLRLIWRRRFRPRGPRSIE